MGGRRKAWGRVWRRGRSHASAVSPPLIRLRGRDSFTPTYSLCLWGRECPTFLTLRLVTPVLLPNVCVVSPPIPACVNNPSAILQTLRANVIFFPSCMPAHYTCLNCTLYGLFHICSPPAAGVLLISGAMSAQYPASGMC